MSKSAPLRRVLRALLADTSPRAKSLIVTVFGDAILPHGGSIWMGSLVALLAPFGVNERLVRTAVLRLTRDNWLVADSVGRRSYYRLTDTGSHRFEEAAQRIYAAGSVPWDGNWSIVMIDADKAEQRDRIRRDLGWLGFASISQSLLLHPNPDRASLAEAIRDDAQDGAVLVLRATRDQLPGLERDDPEKLRRLVQTTWDLDALSVMYQSFLDRFRPALRILQEHAASDPEGAFVVRTLAIHEFRRVLLKDPDLPPELLPPNWPGSTARQLCRNLYLAAEQPAEKHLLDTVETAEGQLPAASARHRARFGGLPAARSRARR
jgi:phenylacetic acid degradation operon negative regulatory protein